MLDIVEFFFIFALLGAVHETAHGMTCKHYGGESHKMGAFLMYLMPGVFCDVTQIYVYGGRWARVATLFAGVWSEIMICSWVTILWWLTPQGSWLHDFLLQTHFERWGYFVVIINLKPFSAYGWLITSSASSHGSFDLKGKLHFAALQHGAQAHLPHARHGPHHALGPQAVLHGVCVMAGGYS